MDDFVFPLILNLDVQSLTMSLVNIASPRGNVSGLADSIEAALRNLNHLDVQRVGDTVIARTDTGHPERVVVAARLDVLSLDEEPLAYVEMGKLFGPGACDAKGALAVTLKAAALGSYSCDVTFVYYPEELAEPVGADFVLLASPTNSAVRGGPLEHPLAQRLIALTDAAPVSEALALDVPAVAFGPGDPSLAGAADEFVPTAELGQCEFVLRQWLTS